jgi:hypothetical protein
MKYKSNCGEVKEVVSGDCGKDQSVKKMTAKMARKQIIIAAFMVTLCIL